MRVAQQREFYERGIEPFIEDNQLRVSLGFTDFNLASKVTEALEAAGMKARYVRLDEDMGEIYQITDIENEW